VSQHDYDLANAAGLAFRSDLNNVLSAIISQNSGLTEPTTTFAYQFWADTTTGILKQRNAINSGWVSLLSLASGKWLGTAAGVTVADAAADTTTWPMLATSQTGEIAPATDAGLTYNASTNVLGSSISGSAASVTTSATVTGAVSSSSTSDGIGYATGAGGSVTQLTSATTNVTLDKICGSVVWFGGTFTGGINYSFLINNTSCTVDDIVIGNTGVISAPSSFIFTAGAGIIGVTFYAGSTGSFPSRTLRFAIIKSVVA
jgi:hypothetical protein